MIPSILAAASDTDWAIITDLVVILVSAAVVAVFMQPMRLAAIPAYLIAGTFIGPRALGLVPSPEGLGAISHLAIILLLFGIGLELHLSVLTHRLHDRGGQRNAFDRADYRTGGALAAE